MKSVTTRTQCSPNYQQELPHVYICKMRVAFCFCILNWKGYVWSRYLMACDVRTNVMVFMISQNNCPQSQQEACRLDSSAIYNWLSGNRTFTKSQIKHCSQSFIWPRWGRIWSLFSQIHRKSWLKSKLGQVGVGSNIAQNHLSSPKKAYLVTICPQCIWKVKWS